MFCSNCGTELKDDAQFCYNCGNPVLKQNGVPAPGAPAGKSPQPDSGQNRVQKTNNGKSKTRILACAVMVIVAAVTIYSVKGFMDQEGGETPVQQGTQTDPQGGNPSGGQGAEASSAPVRTEADYAAAQAFARKYGGEWNVEKYFDGKQWKTYELGKRMLIAAYNFLNDGSYTTGGYNQIVGYNEVTTGEGRTCPKCSTGKMRRVTGLSALLDAADNLQCDFCWYKEVIRTTKTPIYEYVPKEYHEYHGKDIEYSTPCITLTNEAVDMSGMGGSVFDLKMFRVETINGREYLINDELGFALTYDGSYLEYCEPDTYGHYQGYYAFL